PEVGHRQPVDKLLKAAARTLPASAPHRRGLAAELVTWLPLIHTSSRFFTTEIAHPVHFTPSPHFGTIRYTKYAPIVAAVVPDNDPARRFVPPRARPATPLWSERPALASDF